MLLNTAAGGTGDERTAALLRAFQSVGVRVRLEHVGPTELVSALQHWRQGSTVVAVGGGDGSISTVADTLAGTETVLLPLPLGRHNHFAQRYGLASVEAAAYALRGGTIVTVPLGEVNGHHFLNNASCGVYPHLVRRRELLRPVLTPWPAALLALLMVVLQRPLLELEIEVAGSSIRRHAAALWIGIGHRSLRLPEPGDASKEGAVLEIVLPRPHGRLGLLGLAIRLWRRLRNQQTPIDPQLETLRADTFSLRAQRLIDIALDGELYAWPGPLHFRYHERALRVLCLVAPDPPDQGTS